MRNTLQLLLLALVLSAQSCAADDRAVKGKVLVPDGVSLAQAEVWLQLEGGKRLLAFPVADGSFTFAEVPAGVHTLSIQCSMQQQSLMFPTVKLDVTAGNVEAMAADVPGTPGIHYPLLLRPYSRMEYFEKRQPFNPIAFLKTPYGMMGAFMLFSIFIMPKLKIDPEEYKEMMNEKEAGTVTPALINAATQREQAKRLRND